jgi:hypothetical protein
MPGPPQSPLRCPRCASEFVRRASRRGLYERTVSLAYYFPFRCQLCQHRFHALRWGERYVRTGADRREFDRMPVDYWTTLWVRDRQREGRLRDLSIAGATLETDAPVQPGDTLQLQLSPGEGERPVTIDVAVVRSVQSGRAGLQFVRVQGDEHERLRHVVQRLLGAPPPVEDPDA